MIENILYIITKDTPEDIIKREVGALTRTHFCERTITETPVQWVLKFCEAIAKYQNESGHVSQVMDQQFAINMLRNAKVSQDTFNNFFSRLSTVAKKSNVELEHSVLVAKRFLDDLSTVLSGSMNDHLAEECIVKVIALPKQKMQRIN